jgi:hypothetical protein
MPADLDLNLAGGSLYFDPFAVQSFPVHFPVANPKCGSLGKYDLLDFFECRGIAKHRKHRGWATFFHLNRRKEYVEGSRLEQAVLDRSQDFRRKIVQIGLEFDNPFGGGCFFQLTEHCT